MRTNKSNYLLEKLIKVFRQGHRFRVIGGGNRALIVGQSCGFYKNSNSNVY